MGFTLDKVVPWGRSFEEYVRMFDITDDELKLRILGCGDGPSSFNSGMNKRGYVIVSIDPIYQFTAEEIKNRIKETYDFVIEQLHRNKDDFVWDTIRSVEDLCRIRMTAMYEFLDDYEKGKQEKRYLAGSLPRLPFDDNQFDLAICSHFLFLYTEQLSIEFHRMAVTEMCKVASEVRIFPLLCLDGSPSSYVREIAENLQSDEYAVVIEKVPYEFQRGGNQMLRIRHTG